MPRHWYGCLKPYSKRMVSSVFILRRSISGPYAAKYPVTFTRRAYRPCDYPLAIPARKITAEVWCAEGETPQQVVDYHYGSKAVNVVIGEALQQQEGE